MSQRHTLLLLVAIAGCKTDDSPDARRLPPVTSFPDAAIDARPADAGMGGGTADARPADAAPGGAADARVVDASLPMLDAAPPPPAAELLINEVNSNLGTRGLVELLVTQGGTTAGWQLERDYRTSPTVIAE